MTAKQVHDAAAFIRAGATPPLAMPMAERAVSEAVSSRASPARKGIT